MGVHSPNVLSDITGTAAAELRAHAEHKGLLSCGKPSKERSSWNSILTALNPKATQALCLLAGGLKQLLHQLWITERLKLEWTCKGQIPLLAHLLWGSCSIPTCSTVRTANKRLKATQIQGTSLSSSLWPTASGLHSFSRPNTNEDPHTIPGSAADPLKSLAFLLHLLPCTFTGAITLTPHWVEQGLVSVCLHSAVNLQCSHYVNHYYHSLLLPGPTVTGWNSKSFSSFSCFTVSEINSAEVSPEITPPSIYHTLFKCQDSNKPKNLKTLLIHLSTDAHPKETAHGHQHWLRPICLLSQLLLRYSSLQFISLPWLSLCHLNQDLLILSFFLLRGILMKLHQRPINTSNISSLLASLHRAHWNTFFPILPK